MTALPMTFLPDKEPRLVRLIEERDGTSVVEIDWPCTEATERDGPSWTTLVEVPNTNPLISAVEPLMRWPVAVLIVCVTHVGVGSNKATLGELLCMDVLNPQGRVTAAEIADDVVRRFEGALPLGSVKRHLSELCAPPTHASRGVDLSS